MGGWSNIARCARLCDTASRTAAQGMVPNAEMLRGEALLAAGRVKHFTASALPAGAAERFAALFSERER